jgi:hypothetical protein
MLSYISIQFQSLIKSRPPANKPKPNTRFLRNIIKETDSHNAALLAKEAEESRARLESLGSNAHRQERSIRVGGGDIRKRQLGDIAVILGGSSSKLKRSEASRREGKDRRRANTPSHGVELEKQVDHGPKKRKAGEEGEDRKSRHRRRGAEDRTDIEESDHKRHQKRTERHSEDREENDRRRRRAGSSDRARGKDIGRRHGSRSPKERESKMRRRSKSPKRKRTKVSTPETSHRSNMDSKPEPHPESKPDYDSDPLDDIIGPRPPPIQEVRSRGRGTLSRASGIDARFSAAYDPTTDVQLDPDEDDDWDQALEALRDRQKWKQQGADRLRAAGFTEEEISKWEKGGAKREEDVKWAKKGEGREWDRGKVIDGNGLVTPRDWGTLQGATSDGDGVLVSESTWGRLKDT